MPEALERVAAFAVAHMQHRTVLQVADDGFVLLVADIDLVDADDSHILQPDGPVASLQAAFLRILDRLPVHSVILGYGADRHLRAQLHQAALQLTGDACMIAGDERQWFHPKRAAVVTFDPVHGHLQVELPPPQREPLDGPLAHLRRGYVAAVTGGAPKVALLAHDECDGTTILPRPAEKVELTNVLSMNEKAVTHELSFPCLLTNHPLMPGNEGQAPGHISAPRGPAPQETLCRPAVCPK